MIESSKKFRDYGYLAPIRFKDIWGLFQRAHELAENGDVSVARRLVKTCPKPERTEVQMIRGYLKDKHVSRSWWGWDALGVGMSKRSEMIKSFRN